MDFISELDLAETLNTMKQRKIHVLVGYYFNFFLVKILKNSESLVASSTLRGWVLSGPITLGNSSFASVCFETHSRRYNVENIGEGAENLECVLKKFWSIENVEAKGNCVCRISINIFFITDKCM